PPPRPTLFPYTTLFRSAKASSYATGCSLLREGRAIEVDVERDDLAIPYSKYLGYMALERRQLGPLKLVSSQGAHSVPVNKQISRSEEHTSELQSRFDLV